MASNSRDIDILAHLLGTIAAELGYKRVLVSTAKDGPPYHVDLTYKIRIEAVGEVQRSSGEETTANVVLNLSDDSKQAN